MKSPRRNASRLNAVRFRWKLSVSLPGPPPPPAQGGVARSPVTVASGGAALPEIVQRSDEKAAAADRARLCNTNVDNEDTRRYIGQSFDRGQRLTGIRHGGGPFGDAQFKERLR